MHTYVPIIVGQFIERTVSFVPVQVRPGEIDGGGGSGSADSSVYGKRSGIRKQIQHRPSRHSHSDLSSKDPMIEKKTYVDVVTQVDFEFNAKLLNHLALVLLFHPNVLLSLTKSVSLPSSQPEVHPVFVDVEPLANLATHSVEIVTLGFGVAPISGPRKCPDNGIAFAGRILGIQVSKPVDDEWKIWDVPLVETKAGDSLLGAPAA